MIATGVRTTGATKEGLKFRHKHFFYEASARFIRTESDFYFRVILFEATGKPRFDFHYLKHYKIRASSL